MEASTKRAEEPSIHHDILEIRTNERFEFIDLTERIKKCVSCCGVLNGQVNVQSLHTTAAVVINEREPLLIEDFKEFLRRLAPRGARYRHNNLSARRPSSLAEEKPNGDSHARAIILGTSETLNLVDGCLQLGRWQSVFLVELDGSRRRGLSVSILGLGDAR